MPEDVAQSVFCLLAKKASSLTRGTLIVGWLYQTTFFMASRQRRSDDRRRHREQEVAYMRSTNANEGSTAVSWEQIEPALDEAMHQLSDQDRRTLLLRFFKRKPLQEVGEALGISEDAARMRVNRSLEKLRGLLLQRGVACSALALSTLLAERTVQATPVASAQAIRTTVLSGITPGHGLPLSLGRKLMNKMPVAPLLGASLGLLLVLTSAFYLYNQYQEKHLQRVPPPELPVVKSEGNSPADLAPRRPPFTRQRTPQPAVAAAAAEEAESAPAQVNIFCKFIELTQAATNDSGFAWYLGDALVPSGNSPLTISIRNTATAANPRGLVAGPFDSNAVNQAYPTGIFPGGFSGVANPPASQTKSTAGTPFEEQPTTAPFTPLPTTVTGILTDAQFRAMVRALDQRDGVMVTSVPSVTTLSGRQAQLQGPVEISVPAGSNEAGANRARDTKEDPAEMSRGERITNPVQVSSDAASESNSGETARPAQVGAAERGLESRRCDFVLDVIPDVLPDGHTIKLTLIASLSRPQRLRASSGSDVQNGFEPAESGSVPVGATIQGPLTLPRMTQNVVTTTVTVTDGQTVILGGFAEPAVPNQPATGFRRQRLITVTPTIVDPAGNRVHTGDDASFDRNAVPPQEPAPSQPTR